MSFIVFLDTHSGSLTFLITVVYVVATILICRSNRKSAEASEKQLEESKRQFEETKRLDRRPYFSIYLSALPSNCLPEDVTLDLCPFNTQSDCHRDLFLVIHNIGTGVAKRVECSCECDSECFNVDLPFQIIPSQDKLTYKLCIYVPCLENAKSKRFIANLCFTFEDLLENKYSQMFTIIIDQLQYGFDVSDTFIDEPELLGKDNIPQKMRLNNV